MNKLKLSLALFAAYFAGEIVTTAMQVHKLNKAFAEDVLFTKDDLQDATQQTYLQGARDALSDPVLVKEAFENHSSTARTILDYTNV